MRRMTSLFTAACAATLMTASFASAQGTLADRQTNVTFSGAVSLPGTTLPAGTYVFRLADSQANRHIVQIFDKDGAKLITTLFAVPAERDEAHGDPVVAFKETPSDRPPAVHYWYYAGEKAGNEFIYPRAQAMTIAQASGEPVQSFDTDSTDMDAMKTGGVSKVTANAEPQPPATASPTSTTTAPTTAPATTEPTPAPMTTAPTTAPATTAPTTTEPTTAPAPATAPATTEPSTAASQSEQPVGTSGRTESLPKTASQLPMVGLIGLFALAAAFGVRAVRRSMA
jgi:hypothetical protein